MSAKNAPVGGPTTPQGAYIAVPSGEDLQPGQVGGPYSGPLGLGQQAAFTKTVRPFRASSPLRASTAAKSLANEVRDEVRLCRSTRSVLLDGHHVFRVRGLGRRGADDWYALAVGRGVAIFIAPPSYRDGPRRAAKRCPGPSLARAIPAYTRLTREHFLDPKTNDLVVYYLSEEEIKRGGLITDLRELLGRVTTPKKSRLCLH